LDDDATATRPQGDGAPAGYKSYIKLLLHWWWHCVCTLTVSMLPWQVVEHRQSRWQSFRAITQLHLQKMLLLLLLQ